MSDTTTEHPMRHASDSAQLTVVTGSWFEALCGAIGLVFAVVGMLGGDPPQMAAIATIAVGFGVFAQAGTLAARTWRSSDRGDLVGITTDLIAGPVGVALGGFVLLQLVPFSWLPFAALALGTALLFAGRALLGDPKASTRWTAWWVAAMMLTALAALALALLAVAAVQPSTMPSLAAAACVGAGLMLAGGGAHAISHRTGSR